MIRLLYCLLFACLLPLSSCTKEEIEAPTPEVPETYFPPTASDNWETVSLSEVGWDETKTDDLYDYLESNGTRAFLVLLDGKIVIEKYWGKEIIGSSDFGRNSNWYWASAGKTLTASLVGKAQEEGHLSINDKTSDYLGAGWTAMTPEREERITIRHQLTMTTGLDYQASNLDCTDPQCLQYGTDPGQQWFYHNAPYTLLSSVVSSATGQDYNGYTQSAIGQPIGMGGTWRATGNNNVFWSTARDAARFALLIANQGNWAGTQVLGDVDYLADMVSTSQSLNPSYGYLWWLNGKSSIIMPGSSIPFNRSLSPSAPADLYAGMGKDGQFIEVVPSRKLVVIRLGQAPGNDLVPVLFHDEMWSLVQGVTGQGG